MSIDLPFNEVSLKTDDGLQAMSVDQFLAMPLDKRVGAVIQQRVTFALNGSPVNSGLALKALRELMAGSKRQTS